MFMMSMCKSVFFCVGSPLDHQIFPSDGCICFTWNKAGPWWKPSMLSSKTTQQEAVNLAQHDVKLLPGRRWCPSLHPRRRWEGPWPDTNSRPCWTPWKGDGERYQFFIGEFILAVFWNTIKWYMQSLSIYILAVFWYNISYDCALVVMSNLHPHIFVRFHENM